MLKLLSCSILLVIAISCKKKAVGLFEDFPPGKFDFVWTTNHNGINDTLAGEVSGPYPIQTDYFFTKRLTNGDDNLSFSLDSKNIRLTINNLHFDAKITNFLKEENYLIVDFNKQDTLIGSLNLTRK